MPPIEADVRAIFLAALERAPEQWPDFLVEACRDNTELRERVELLLKSHQAQGSIHGGDPDATGGGAFAGERSGTVIGPYKLLQQIGEGGMGVVWMAEQTEPVKRKVALKVIKPGMDSRQVIARFEAERQALALRIWQNGNGRGSDQSSAGHGHAWAPSMICSLMEPPLTVCSVTV